MQWLFWIIGLLSLANPSRPRSTRSTGAAAQKDSARSSLSPAALIRVNQKEYQLSPVIVRRLRELGMTWQIRSNSLVTSEPLIDENGQIDWDRLKGQVKLK